ncbi:MAG: phosphate/phosphite/phosphonate ABC transporter substrate-binding protein [Synergistaceae bacterium]|jgi:phosphonate transport system substrate-binding protein|nr:phosphate/phosphite/phosphonate ABC transporter substrate-binding protein [Synergistaceae bacterium]
MFKKWMLVLMALLVALSLAIPASAAETANDLDARYRDDDGDLTADAPLDPKDWENPDVLVFADAPLEDVAEFRTIYAGFLDFLSQKTGKKVEYRVLDTNSGGIEDMRAGRLHLASFSTGATCYAVNLAGYVPIAVKGDEKSFQGYRLIVLVKSDSPIQDLEDLRGKKVAHTSPTSNSGHIAAVALFPQEGLTPGEDYEIVFAGNHEKAILGVGTGEYEAACVGSSLFERVVSGGDAREADYRIVWESSTFPTSSFGYAHDLHPELVGKIKEAFFEYRFTPSMIKTFGGMDRFSPITYLRDEKVARLIAGAGGEKFDEAGLKVMAEAENQALEKKKAKP